VLRREGRGLLLELTLDALRERLAVEDHRDLRQSDEEEDDEDEDEDEELLEDDDEDESDEDESDEDEGVEVGVEVEESDSLELLPGLLLSLPE